MPVLPKYTQQVSPGVAEIPNAPKLDLTGGLAGLKEIGNANINLGETTQKIAGVLADHAEQQFKIQNEANVSNLNTQFRQEIQNKLFDESPQTVNVNGQDVTRPTGVLVRQLGQAKGATVDFDQQYQQMRAGYLSQVKDPAYRASLQSGMDNYFTSLRDGVIKHEATQGQANLVNTFESSVAQQAKDAYTAQNPNDLNNAIANMALATDKVNKAKSLDPETASLNLQKSTLNVAENAVLGKLQTTGSVDQSMALLDSVKDKLTPQNYMALQEKVQKQGVVLQQQATHAAIVQKTQTRFDTINGFLNGTLKTDNSQDLIRKLAITDPKAGEALQEVLESKDSQFTPISETGDTYSKVVSNVFKSGTPEQVSKFAIDALKENANGNMSREQLSILYSAAIQRSKSFLPDGSLRPTQIAIDGGMDAVLRWNNAHGNKSPDTITNYLADIANNKSPQEAYNNAIKTTIIKHVPQAATMDNPPSVVVDNSAQRYFVSPETDSSKFPFIYDEAAKRIVPNSNYKQKRPEKK